jgi:L-rhamnose mutarotase
MSDGPRVQRFASVVGLRPEKEAEYLALHAGPWPEVLERLSRYGVLNFSIFLRDNQLFSYLEYAGADYKSEMAALAADDVMRRWLQLTDACQQPVATARDGQWWAPAAEVFHLGEDARQGP